MSDIVLWYAGGKNHWKPTILTEQELGKTEETLDQTKEQAETKGKTLALLRLIFRMSSFAVYVFTTQIEISVEFTSRE